MIASYFPLTVMTLSPFISLLKYAKEKRSEDLRLILLKVVNILSNSNVASSGYGLELV
jgi:hypothetical protein